MRIEQFERSEFCCIGLVVGDGLQFRFLALNDTGKIERLEQKIDGEWLVDPDPPPLFLRTLIAAKFADERWRHGEP